MTSSVMSVAAFDDFFGQDTQTVALESSFFDNGVSE